MRNLMEQLTPRHFVVMSLALMLVLGGVSAAFANRDDVQPARKEDSASAEAVAVDDDGDDDDDDTNGDTRLSRLTASPSATGSPSVDVTDNDGTDSDGVDTTGIAAANWTDNDGTDSDGFDTTGAAADDSADTDSGDDSDSN